MKRHGLSERGSDEQGASARSSLAESDITRIADWLLGAWANSLGLNKAELLDDLANEYSFFWPLQNALNSNPPTHREAEGGAPKSDPVLTSPEGGERDG